MSLGVIKIAQRRKYLKEENTTWPIPQVCFSRCTLSVMNSAGVGIVKKLCYSLRQSDSQRRPLLTFARVPTLCHRSPDTLTLWHSDTLAINQHHPQPTISTLVTDLNLPTSWRSSPLLKKMMECQYVWPMSKPCRRLTRHTPWSCTPSKRLMSLIDARDHPARLRRRRQELLTFRHSCCHVLWNRLNRLDRAALFRRSLNQPAFLCMDYRWYFTLIGLFIPLNGLLVARQIIKIHKSSFYTAHVRRQVE